MNLVFKFMVRGVGLPEGKLQNRSEVNINPHASMDSVARSGFLGLRLGLGNWVQVHTVCVCLIRHQ